MLSEKWKNLSHGHRDYWEGLSNHGRRMWRNALVASTGLVLIFVIFDYFADWFGRVPIQTYIKYKPPFDYIDHLPSYIFFGIMATLGTIISFAVLLKVSKKEANTQAEYLDIYNEILGEIQKDEEFYILSPAHNGGQRDAYNGDKIIEKKYRLNQELLIEKAIIGKGEYTMLEYYKAELETFAGDSQDHERLKIIAEYPGAENSIYPNNRETEQNNLVDATDTNRPAEQRTDTNLVDFGNLEIEQAATVDSSDLDPPEAEQNNPYSPMFHFLMGFSKRIEVPRESGRASEITENPQELIERRRRVEEYVREAFINLNKLLICGLQVKAVRNRDYMEAPLVVIITERAAYFGLYKLVAGSSKAVIRGIKVSDKDGIDTLKILYKTMSFQFDLPVSNEP